MLAQRRPHLHHLRHNPTPRLLDHPLRNIHLQRNLLPLNQRLRPPSQLVQSANRQPEHSRRGRGPGGEIPHPSTGIAGDVCEGLYCGAKDAGRVDEAVGEGFAGQGDGFGTFCAGGESG